MPSLLSSLINTAVVRSESLSLPMLACCEVGVTIGKLVGDDGPVVGLLRDARDVSVMLRNSPSNGGTEGCSSVPSGSTDIVRMRSSSLSVPMLSGRDAGWLSGVDGTWLSGTLRWSVEDHMNERDSGDDTVVAATAFGWSSHS